jgi:hypothetical protein
MRIFTDTEFMRGRIPRRENFRPALEQFEQDCVIPYLLDKVVGAFAYGSVNRSDCSPASDIDYYMVIDDHLHKRAISQAAARAMEERCVLLQTRVFDLESAQQGHFRIDTGFYQHLAISAEKHRCLGHNPLELLGQKDMLFRDSLIQSMEIYLSKLDSRFIEYHGSEEKRAELAKTIIEKPFHAVRCYLQHELGSVLPDNLRRTKDDTKQHLLWLYTKVCHDERMLNLIRQIDGLSKEYIVLLDQRLGEPKKTNDPNLVQKCADAKTPKHLNMLCDWHHSLVDSILSSYGAAYDFIRENMRAMDNSDK